MLRPYTAPITLRRKVSGRRPSEPTHNTMKVVIVAHGDAPSRGLLEACEGDCDLLIATDGAANALIQEGLRPDVVLGDFDSLDPQIQRDHPEIRFEPAPSQEASDLDKAVAFALEQGAAVIRI